MSVIKGNVDEVLSEHGWVDVGNFIETIQKKSDTPEVDVQDINRASRLGALYVAEDGKILIGYNEDDYEKAKYKIVPIGLYLNDTGFPLLASFVKGTGKKKKKWFGAYVGTGYQLFQMYERGNKTGRPFCNNFKDVFCGRWARLELVGFGLKDVLETRLRDLRAAEEAEKKGIEAEARDIITSPEGSGYKLKDTISQSVCDAVSELEAQSDTQEIEQEDNKFNITPNKDIYNDSLLQFMVTVYQRLLYKESWMTTGTRRFDFYLKSLIKMLEIKREQDGDKQSGNGYVYNSEKTACLMNLGLLDTFGNNIYIVDKTPHMSEFQTKNLAVMSSKIELLQFGFDNNILRNLPEPIKVYDNISDLVFRAEVDDFDLINVARLNHIIDERRSRFPDSIRGETDEQICERIKRAVSRAVLLSKTDCRYAVPKFDFQRKKIQFLIPFHINRLIDEPPELVLVVGDSGHVWSVYTILSLEDAMADSRLVSRTQSWLRQV